MIARPKHQRMVLVILAVIAVILVSRVADDDGGRAGLAEALLAGTTIGLFGIVINQFSEGHVFGPLSVVRTIQTLLVAAVVLVTGAAWRPERRLLPPIAAVGVLDMAGNGLYILAVQTGFLAVASVLSSLYPVATVLLATVVLKERVTRDHAIGIALAALAIGCIAAGSS